MFQQLSQVDRDLVAEVAAGLIPMDKKFCYNLIDKAISESRFGIVKVVTDKLTSEDIVQLVINAIKENNAAFMEYTLSISELNPLIGDNMFIGVAAASGSTDALIWLLDRFNANPGARSQYAIGAAAANGHLEIVKILLAHPQVDPTVGKNFALRQACDNGHTKIAKLLFNDPRVAKCVDDNRNFLIHCINANNIGSIRIMLELLETINPKLLLATIRSGIYEISVMLVNSNKIDLTYNDFEPFKSSYMNVPLINAITEKLNRETPAHYDVLCKAMLLHQTDVVECLLSKMDVRSQSQKILKSAIGYKRPTYVRMVLQLIEINDHIIEMLKSAEDEKIRELAKGLKTSDAVKVEILEAKVAELTRQLANFQSSK